MTSMYDLAGRGLPAMAALRFLGRHPQMNPRHQTELHTVVSLAEELHEVGARLVDLVRAASAHEL
jgi:hypothetical protein